MYKITCFIPQDKAELYRLLTPIGFKKTNDDRMYWENQLYSCVIEHFSVQGYNEQGYRVYIKGNRDFAEYIFVRSFGCFSPVIRGVEFIYSTNQTQEKNIETAAKLNLKTGALYGIFKYKDVGIVMLPNGEVNIQIRSKQSLSLGLVNVMKKIDEAVQFLFKPTTFNLFSFLEEEQEEYVL